MKCRNYKNVRTEYRTPAKINLHNFSIYLDLSEYDILLDPGKQEIRLEEN